MSHPLVSNEGMDCIATTCSRAGAFFFPSPRQDVGIDGYIEFLDKQNRPTGSIVLVQCNAGLSYISASGKYQIRAQKHLFQTWPKYPVTVVGIVYNPRTRDAHWINISTYLKTHPTVIEQGPYVIETPDDLLFTEESFAEFQNTLEATSQVHSDSAQELVDRYLTGDRIAKEIALIELFSRYRWTPLACFFIHQLIRVECDQSLLAYIIDMTAYYLSPRTGYDLPSKEVPEELEAQAKGYVRDFEIPEIIKLLFSLVVGKGLHQLHRSHPVELQLETVNDIRSKLCSIIRNQHIESTVRYSAVDILILALNYHEREFYEDVLIKENDPMIIEVLNFAVEACAERNGESL